MLSHSHGEMMGHRQPEALRHSQVLKHPDSDVDVVLMEMFGSSHIWAGHSNILDKMQILTPPYYLSNILPHPFP